MGFSDMDMAGKLQDYSRQKLGTNILGSQRLWLNLSQDLGLNRDEPFKEFLMRCTQ